MSLALASRKLLGMGRQDPNNPAEPFNMAYLAVHGSGAVNGVSRLHGAVSRRLFSSLFPRWPEREVPVEHVTNGVHVGTWESPEADALWERACGPDRSAGDPATLGQQLRALPDDRSVEIANQRIERIDRLHSPASVARARQPEARRQKKSPPPRASSTLTRSRWDLPGALPLTSGPIFCCAIQTAWLAF